MEYFVTQAMTTFIPPASCIDLTVLWRKVSDQGQLNFAMQSVKYGVCETIGYYHENTVGNQEQKPYPTLFRGDLQDNLDQQNKRKFPDMTLEF